MGIYTKEEQLELINRHWENLRIIENQYEDVCLKAVKKCGWALQYVKEQTEEICLEAIKQNEMALQYVKEQTEEMCMQAIKENVNSLAYVKHQTHEICLKAVKKEAEIISKVRKKTPVLCFYAFLQNYNAIKTKYIKNGLEKFIKDKNIIENNTFCLSKYRYKYEYCDYISLNSFKSISKFLIEENSNNTYIIEDSFVDFYNLYLYINRLALSNNNLIFINTGSIKDIHRKLSNKIITIQDLEKGSF